MPNKPAPHPSLAISTLLLGAVGLMSPHREIVVVFCSALIFFALWLLLYKYELNWSKRWIRHSLCVLAFLSCGMLAAYEWPRSEKPEIVLRVEDIMLPTYRTTETIYAISIYGRFPSNVHMSYGAADTRSEYWPPKEEVPHPSSAFRYTLINRGSSALYNLKLPIEVVHQEAIATDNGFRSGDVVYRFNSTVQVPELIPYGLSDREENFVFYIRNLGEDFLLVTPSNQITLDDGKKVKMRTVGIVYSLAPPKVLKDKDEKKGL